MQELKIKPEFQKLIPPLSEHEKEGLEAEIRYWARLCPQNLHHTMIEANNRAPLNMQAVLS